MVFPEFLLSLELKALLLDFNDSHLAKKLPICGHIQTQMDAIYNRNRH